MTVDEQAPRPTATTDPWIHIRGARQHNLKNIDVSIPLGAITAVTGVSGSGKSSLAFDTLYAEGQRRYVESFSPYARQFMDRMDRPEVDSVEGVLPAVAIDQTNSIRASRSTVGTITELNDFIKLLYARAGQLYCEGCGEAVRPNPADAAATQLIAEHGGARAVVTFALDAGSHRGALAAREWLASQGFRRIRTGSAAVPLEEGAVDAAIESGVIEVAADRIQLDPTRHSRVVEALEAAYRNGQGRAAVYIERGEKSWTPARFSASAYHCAECDRRYPEPVPNHFSTNSPLGACETCNGFGAVIGLDLDLVIPNPKLTLEGGAIRPWTTPRSEEERTALYGYCERAGVPIDVPWGELSESARKGITEGDKKHRWYGIRGWFKWLESRTYRMHVRVLLSKYRAYTDCPDCRGTRFRPYALQYRLGGLNPGELAAHRIGAARQFFEDLELGVEGEAALTGVLAEVRARLRYLCEVGVDYLTLDRQSRTLSGGEVQRVNLTTAIGSALVNTLYVLDEPSIGLHARDNERLLGILRRLRANRNTIVLVEHDDAVIEGADHIIDIGPGPGAAGGRVVFAGTPEELSDASADSATAAFLRGKGARMPAPPRRPLPAPYSLWVRGAGENNLRGIDVEIPLGRLTVVTGVSGSGKSTLVGTVLHRGLQRLRGQPVEKPGAHDRIEGAERLEFVVSIDQTPVGTTPRSNAATYTKAYDGIRAAFARTEPAKRLGFSASTFSFNTAGGRCDACDGNGFERVEMQFLSDQFVTCEKCHGRRFKPDVLGVRLRGRSIDEVLELTASEAIRFFDDEVDVRDRLTPVATVGLGYLRIGQPLNTLSGGESQRLKLAYHLGLAKSRGGLFLIDEPTTGLHLSDVRQLAQNLQQLVDADNTVVVVEHHLDLIAQADYVIDLGPEGGDGGGEVVCAGPPEEVANHDESHTGRYLATHFRREHDAGEGSELRSPVDMPMLAPAEIVVRGARINNLHGVDIDLPRGQFIVITGPSGSGKSSLAFDVLFAEGQRRFVDCLSPYARQYVQQVGRPDLDELAGIPPTVCISQRMSRGGRKSTVATVTEIYHYLRLVWSRIGVQHCHQCGSRVSGLDPANLVDKIAEHWDGKAVRLLAPAVRARKGWHKDILKRAKALGHSTIRVDGEVVRVDPMPELARYQEHDLEYVVAEWTVSAKRTSTIERYVEAGLALGDGTLFIAPATGKRAKTRIYSLDLYCSDCSIGFEPPDPRLFSFNTKAGACRKCHGYGLAGSADSDDEAGDERDLSESCPDCGGSRLNALARSVRVHGVGMDEVIGLTPSELGAFVRGLALSERDEAIARQALDEVSARSDFLAELGLDHLTLGRSAHTLSGGEAQRIRLASQLSATLRGVLYVLDEPTIGLHPEDNGRLLRSLTQLVDAGNSVVVVEHDEETIRLADHLIEMGPGGGSKGGRVVEQGPARELLERGTSLTAQELRQSGAERAVRRDRKTTAKSPGIVVRGATHNNLKGDSARFPYGRLTVVTGVSGSGKSSLVRDVLGQGLRRAIAGSDPLSGKLDGAKPIRLVRDIDQSPIGRTPASTPATYVGLYDRIRKLFAALPEAKARGYRPGRFSFNVKEGRCQHCKGQGQVRHEMAFLPDVYVGCEVCEGRRFSAETCEVTYRDHSIADVLQLTVSEAAELFGSLPSLSKTLELLKDVGLDYLKLGQPSNTLSGGEAQRIKLVEELRKEGGQKAVYILDEPSTGLHLSDLRRLLSVLQRIVDRGDTVVVIEHNLDVVASADWVVDLGPTGGTEGGQILFEGPPQRLAAATTSTGRYLAAHLAPAV